MKYVGNTDVSCFGYNFMSPKWTRTELVIVVSPSPQAYISLLLVKRSYWFLCTYPEVLIAIGLILVVHGNENLFSMFWYATFVFRVPKCEVVNFDKYSLAGANGMSISDLWHATYTYGGWLACLHVPCNACMMSLHMR